MVLSLFDLSFESNRGFGGGGGQLVMMMADLDGSAEVEALIAQRPLEDALNEMRIVSFSHQSELFVRRDRLVWWAFTERQVRFSRDRFQDGLRPKWKMFSFLFLGFPIVGPRWLMLISYQSNHK